MISHAFASHDSQRITPHLLILEQSAIIRTELHRSNLIQSEFYKYSTNGKPHTAVPTEKRRVSRQYKETQLAEP